MKTPSPASQNDYSGMKRYGVPYKGSKNAIAAWIAQTLPAATNFYDLCAGGCAVTHAAMKSGKYARYFCNDIDGGGIALFCDAVAGKFAQEARWISRADFFRLKDSEPYVRFCWSFGNGGDSYLYSKEIEPWKKALHFARVFGDVSLLREFGIASDGSCADIRAHHAEYAQKYAAWYKATVLQLTDDKIETRKRLARTEEELRGYLCDALRASGLTQKEIDRRTGVQMSGHWFGKSQWTFPTRDFYTMLQQWLPLPLPYDALVGSCKQSLERLQSLQSLGRLEGLQSLQRLEHACASYDEVPILPDSVIYCDIPYKDTEGYGMEFDHARFYQWAQSQKELCVISEYAMPDDFMRVAFIQKRVTMSATANSTVK